MNTQKINPKIGEVYMMQFGGSGSEQKGLRPGIVFQNNVGNTYSPNVIALPMTSVIKKRNQPTHVFLDAKSHGLKRDSVVLCENPECMSKEKIGAFITKLSDEDMKRITEANLIATSAIAFLDLETLTRAWKKASSLNRAKHPA